VGATGCRGGGDYLDADGPFQLSGAVTVSKLSGYVTGGGASQKVRGVIYADSGGSPGSLVAVTPEVTIAAAQAAGWVDLVFSGSVSLAAGSYWIGYWYGPSSNGALFSCTNGVSGIEHYVSDGYSSSGSPNNLWGNGQSAGSSYSLYATYSGS
jgi:hypothetical protein